MLVEGFQREYVKVDVEPIKVVDRLLAKYKEACVGSSAYDLNVAERIWYKDVFNKRTKIREATEEEVENIAALERIYRMCCKGALL